MNSNDIFIICCIFMLLMLFVSIVILTMAMMLTSANRKLVKLKIELLKNRYNRRRRL